MVFAPNERDKTVKEHVGFRMRMSLMDYVRRRSKKSGGEPERGELTRIFEEAVELHRAVFQRLEPHLADLQRAAEEEGLEFPAQFNELLIRLVERGLKSSKRK